MTGNAGHIDERRAQRWRIAVWCTAGLLLLLPLVAMQLSDEVNWDLTDFAVFGALLAGARGLYELGIRAARGNHRYGAALGMAIATTFLLIWVNGAVGILGSENNPANWMYGGVLAIGLLGAAIARLKPHGMARTLAAMAVAQALVAIIAVSMTMAELSDALIGTAVFVPLWLASAWLFRKAGQAPRV